MSWLISSKYLPISFSSWMNLTLPSVSEDSSMAWLKPFSPPYDTSTTLMTLAWRRLSNISEAFRSFLKSAEPARMIPATLTLSLVTPAATLPITSAESLCTVLPYSTCVSAPSRPRRSLMLMTPATASAP